jgi:hypothetical protein
MSPDLDKAGSSFKINEVISKSLPKKGARRSELIDSIGCPLARSGSIRGRRQ